MALKTHKNIGKGLLLGFSLIASQLVIGQNTQIKTPSDVNFTDFQSGVVRVEKNDKVGFADKQGKEVSPIQYENAFDMSEDMAAVRKAGKWGYINKLGKEVIPFT